MERVEEQQSKALSLLHTVYSTFHHFSTDLSDDDDSKSDEIKHAIRTYFLTEKMPDSVPQLDIQVWNFQCTFRASHFIFRNRSLMKLSWQMTSSTSFSPSKTILSMEELLREYSTGFKVRTILLPFGIERDNGERTLISLSTVYSRLQRSKY